jgi:hypothetical protein
MDEVFLKMMHNDRNISSELKHKYFKGYLSTKMLDRLSKGCSLLNEQTFNIEGNYPLQLLNGFDLG